MDYIMKCICEKGMKVLELEETRFLAAYEKVKSINPKLASWLWDMRGINYERFWEIALAELKQKKVMWADIKGMDHSDGTEVKTLRYSWDTYGKFWSGSVGNLKHKTGNIKIVIYNPNTGQFLFVFLTNKQMRENVPVSGTMRFSFPKIKEPTGWWVKYIVPFEKFIKL